MHEVKWSELWWGCEVYLSVVKWNEGKVMVKYECISSCHFIVTCTPLIRRVLVRMIGFISSWLHTHNYIPIQCYSAISRLHQLQFTVAINAGIWHAENAALCIVVCDVTEVTWSFLAVAQSSVTAQPSNARCGAKRGEGRGGNTRQRSATVAHSRSLRFLNFISSCMKWLRHSIFQYCYCLVLIMLIFC
jgi:hypothetical protein